MLTCLRNYGTKALRVEACQSCKTKNYSVVFLILSLPSVFKETVINASVTILIFIFFFDTKIINK